jgi:hypothetical protein
LQKSKVASVRIFGETLIREPVDDSDNLSRPSEVAHEFCARWLGPPQISTRKPRLRPSEFLTPSTKRLLQHYRHTEATREAAAGFRTLVAGTVFHRSQADERGLFIQPSSAASYKHERHFLLPTGRFSRVQPFHIIHSNPWMPKQLSCGDIWRLFDEFRIT